MAIVENRESGMSGHKQERRQPLLFREDDDRYGDNNNSNGSTAMLFLSTGVAVLGGFHNGTCVGYSSPTQSEIREELGLSISQFSVFGSILMIGGMVGAVTCGPITEHFGRKGALRLSSMICLMGWLVIFFSQGALLLYFGRFSIGYGSGIISYVVPVYIAEISPAHLRGGLALINQIMLSVGISASYIIGTFVNWRTLTFSGIIPCILLLIGLFVILESPRWLAKMGYHEELQSTLQVLQGKDADISQELKEIQECIEVLQSFPKATWKDLFQIKYSRTVTVGVGLMVLQQFGGVSGVTFYASETFADAGLSSEYIGNITLGLNRVIFAIIGATLMDKSGRRPLLLVSAAGTFLGTFVAGVSFYLKGQGLFSEWSPMMALVGILVYMGFYSIGMGGIPWVIMSEIFPVNIKGIGGSFVTLTSWFGSWIVSYGFNFLMDWSSSGTFFMFSMVSLFTIIFIAKVVPETKGRILEEIQSSLNSEM